jgi:hypothetical protein
MNLDPQMITSPVFRFPRCAARNHTICQKEKFLKIRVSHSSSCAPAINKHLPIYSSKPDEIFIWRCRGGRACGFDEGIGGLTAPGGSHFPEPFSENRNRPSSFRFVFFPLTPRLCSGPLPGSALAHLLRSSISSFDQDARGILVGNRERWMS